MAASTAYRVDVQTPAGKWMRCAPEFWQDVDAVAFARKCTTTPWRVRRGNTTLATGTAGRRNT